MTEEERTAADVPLPGGNFRLFITRLSYQALMSLGIIENPLTNTKQQQLPNARMLIEDLEMLSEKTAGNLDDDEAKLLDSMLYELRMRFVEAGP